jgi:hypothetical protein
MCHSALLVGGQLCAGPGVRLGRSKLRGLLFQEPIPGGNLSPRLRGKRFPLVSRLLTEFRKLRLGLRGHRVAVGRDLLEGFQG